MHDEATAVIAATAAVITLALALVAWRCTIGGAISGWGFWVWGMC